MEYLLLVGTLRKILKKECSYGALGKAPNLKSENMSLSQGFANEWPVEWPWMSHLTMLLGILNELENGKIADSQEFSN